MSSNPSDATPGRGAKLDPCPACGQQTSLDDLLASSELGAEVARFADGAVSFERAAFQVECASCKERFDVPARQIEAAIIERQTADLFSSMSQILRGKAKLQ